MLASVIIPNNNRPLNIAINSIAKSTAKKIDVSIVNWGKERSYQRNVALDAALGDAILVLDSDQSVSPELIDECIGLLKEGFSAIYIPEIIVANSFFGKIRKFERMFMIGTAVDVPRFVLKSACPRFDETLHGPEDADWGNRIKGFRTISKNVLYHHDDISFWEYCKKKAYYTKSLAKYSEKWPNDYCLNLKYRCWTIFVEKGKWKMLLKHPILTLGMVFLLLVRGIIYVTFK